VRVLQRLPGLQHDLATAQAEADLIGQFGVDRDGPTPFQLWRLQTERALLDAAVAENRRDDVETKAAFTQARADERGYEQQLGQIAEEKYANGGGAIDERLREIRRLKDSKDSVHRANLTFQARTESINLVEPETVEQFAEAQVAAADFLAGYEKRLEALQAEEETAQEALSPLRSQLRDLLAEKESLKGRAGMVPRRLHEARVRMAEAAGLDPMSDLPIVAELLDVNPKEDHWRKAIETTPAASRASSSWTAKSGTASQQRSTGSPSVRASSSRRCPSPSTRTGRATPTTCPGSSPSRTPPSRGGCRFASASRASTTCASPTQPRCPVPSLA
jgi:hypothetical protein